MDVSAWELVDSIEMFADLDQLPRLVPASNRCVGVVVARPHPTGWFLSAHHRRGLAAAELEHFAEFVRVRAFLLITEGPRVSTWQPVGDVAWLAWSMEEHLDLIDAIPDALPVRWA